MLYKFGASLGGLLGPMAHSWFEGYGLIPTFMGPQNGGMLRIFGVLFNISERGGT